MYNYTLNPDIFGLTVMRALLAEAAVTAEFSARFGVSPSEIRRCGMEPLERLDDTCDAESAAATAAIPDGAARGHGAINAEDIQFLLSNYEHELN
jgi:hypothetical protein